MKNIKLIEKKWVIGFVEGGYETIFNHKKNTVHWVKNPKRDRWYADPFILSMDDDVICILAEEYRFDYPKGRIAKLTIDRHNWRIIKDDIVLETKTHLSFPNILRLDGKIYVYPENCRSGKMSIYEYEPDQERLVFKRVICDDALWDSSITNLFGKWQLFGGKTNGCCMDVYNWSDTEKKFVFDRTYESQKRNYQLAGQLFSYEGGVYCPTQDATETYGGAIEIMKIVEKEDGLEFIPTKRLTSPNFRYRLGMHTLNEYNGMLVIDVKGFNSVFTGITYHCYKIIKGLYKHLFRH